jgi:hypothetical protein
MSLLESTMLLPKMCNEALAKRRCSAICRYDVPRDDVTLFSSQADDAPRKSTTNREGHTAEYLENVPGAKRQGSDYHLESHFCRTEET